MRRTAGLLFILIPLLVHLAVAAIVALRAPFPAPIDELQHLSYVRAMARAPALFPDFAHMAAIGGEPNYLNHPSVYYLLLSPLAHSPEGMVLRLRLANVLLSLAGVAIAMLAASRVLSRGWLLLFGLVLVAFPKLGIVGGLVNNDNLGLIAAALLFAAVIAAERESRWTAVLAAVALALGGWTKLTVLVMLAPAAAFAVLLLWRRHSPRWRGLAVGAAIGLAIGAIPTLHSLMTTGAVIWTSPTHNAVPPGERPVLGFADYAVLFVGQLGEKWGALDSPPVFALVGLLAMIAAGAWAVRRQWAKKNGPATATAAAFALALVPALAIHLYYGWRAFEAIGDLTSAQSRYYYALWPGFALAATLWLREHWRKPLARAAALVAGLSLLATGPWIALLTLR